MLWTVSETRAWDADGRGLDVDLALDPDGMRLEVDTQGARFPITVDPILETGGLTFSGTSVKTRFGIGVAMDGDVNGDGYDDLVIVYGYGSTYSTGYLLVYKGSASGPTSTGASTISTPSSGAEIRNVANAGDVNGDGYDDIIASDYGYSSNAGIAWIFHGSSSGLASSPTTTITGSGTALLGYAMDGAGDVNKDGYDDVIIGAYYTSSKKGAAYVYHGSASGVSSTASTSLSDGRSSSNFGYSVGGAGDVNGDGYDDVIVGAQGESTVAGRAYVYHGSSSGISSTAATTLTAVTTGDYFGVSANGAGDLDGDGYDDVGVGTYTSGTSNGVRFCYGSSSGISSTGCDTVTSTNTYHGTGVFPLGDVDLDGYADVAVANYVANYFSGQIDVHEGGRAGIDTTLDSSFTGPATYAYFSWAASGGDANGDGYGDLAVGAWAYSSYYGQVNWYMGDGDADGDDVGTSLDCDDADSTVGAVTSLYPDADSDGYGSSTLTSACAGPGYTTVTGDCDDTDATVYPGAPETGADGVDQDCDDGDACFTDGDGDGYVDSSTTIASSDLDCRDAGEKDASAPSGDCDDDDADINPGETEIAGDEVDQDCDDAETCYTDADSDGYRPDATSTTSSADTDCDDAGEATDDAPTTDCDDSAASANPDGTEVAADGIDGNCDGTERCYVDADDDGARGSSMVNSSDGDCADSGEALASDDLDCDDDDDTVYPDATETIGDEVDSDCDGGEICYLDEDDDGFRAEDDATKTSADTDCSDSGETVSSEVDCDDDDESVFPGRPELCNGVDDDCDGEVDSPSPLDGTTWYTDADGDGYTTEAGTTIACDEPDGYSTQSAELDCDDTSAESHPGGTETPDDGLDQDCDGADETSSSGSSGGGSSGGDSGSSGGSGGGTDSGEDDDEPSTGNTVVGDIPGGCGAAGTDKAACNTAPGGLSPRGLALGALALVCALRRRTGTPGLGRGR